MSFARALEVFYPFQRPAAGIHPTAVIAPDVRLGRNVSIGPYVVIEAGAELGDDCILKSQVMIYPGAKIGDRFFAHSHATVRENVRIGNDVILQNGVVIGGDGFGFVPRPDGTFYKIPQTGIVVIGTVWKFKPIVALIALRWVKRDCAGALRLITWCKWPTAATSAKIPCSAARWESPAALKWVAM